MQWNNWKLIADKIKFAIFIRQQRTGNFYINEDIIENFDQYKYLGNMHKWEDWHRRKIDQTGHMWKIELIIIITIVITIILEQ